MKKLMLILFAAMALFFALPALGAEPLVGAYQIKITMNSLEA